MARRARRSRGDLRDLMRLARDLGFGCAVVLGILALLVGGISLMAYLGQSERPTARTGPPRHSMDGEHPMR